MEGNLLMYTQEQIDFLFTLLKRSYDYLDNVRYADREYGHDALLKSLKEVIDARIP